MARHRRSALRVHLQRARIRRKSWTRNLLPRREHMKARAVLLIVVVCFACAAASYGADDAFTGTWKLNEAKSKLRAGGPKNNTVVYDASGDSVKVTIDGTGHDGAATHSEWTGKFDGKEYPVTGDSAEDAR